MANTYLQKLNNLYGKTNLPNLATATFQDVVDSKNAILSIFSHTGIAGFKFHIPQREQVNFVSRVTNHYLENNESAQDHIVNEPIQITLSGYQGEYFYPLQKYEALIAEVVPTLGLVTQLMPKITDITKQVKNAKLAAEEAQRINNSLNYNVQLTDITTRNSSSAISQAISTDILNNPSSKWDVLKETAKNEFNAVDLFSLFQNIYKLKSAQTRAYLFFEALWKAKMLFSVETSWKRYDNMTILNVTPIRDNNADITDFKITLQQINRTYSKSILTDAAGRTQDQLADVVNKGTDTGLKVDVSNNSN